MTDTATLSSKNTCSKTRPKSRPYEVWVLRNGWRVSVLKKYKSPKGEAADPFARWFCRVEGDYDEMGDQYAADIKRMGTLIHTNYDA